MMFKKIIILIAVVFAAYSVNAQAAFEKGDLGVNVGVKLGGVGTTFLPGLSASAEYGMFPIGKAGVISLGGNFDASFGSGSIYMRPAFRAAFHLGFLNTEKFDVYGGIMSGIRLYGSNTLFWDDFIGGRYMFKDNMGVFAEVGFLSATNLRGGLCWIL